MLGRARDRGQRCAAVGDCGIRQCGIRQGEGGAGAVRAINPAREVWTRTPNRPGFKTEDSPRRAVSTCTAGDFTGCDQYPTLPRTDAVGRRRAGSDVRVDTFHEGCPFRELPPFQRARVCTLTDPPLNVPHEPLPASTCVLSAFHWLVWCVETHTARPASASSNSDLMCHTPRDTLRHCRGMFESNTARTRFDARSSRGGGTNCTLREHPHVPGRRVVCWTAVGVVAHAHLTRSARRTRLRPARPPPTCARHAPCRRPPSPAAPESGAWRARPPS